ncbi:DEKNAAC102347 [Brettanomyces naardenensis]|uniref:alpha-1,2-Mannosidase n=1 Tax=Brettanomyces naardenensis TaxID=13370 RepID=A0A448YLC6_BRENA|nr:DEKNAAC102347 [Brettanomyces naardenensis]
MTLLRVAVDLLILFINVCTCEPETTGEIFSKYSYTSNYTDGELFQSTYTDEHLRVLKGETKHLFDYGFGQYMVHGFPFDEVKPIGCSPNHRNRRNPDDTVKNDVMGNFTVTLIDNLDTFIIMDDFEGFQRSVNMVKTMYNRFDIDSTVQVFETNIRILGGLLSAHLYASDPRKGHQLPDYDGFLLNLAYDIGKRLVLAFDNDIKDSLLPSEHRILIPFPRTNLLKGPKKVSKSLQIDQCTAGVTSLIVEFSLLSRLSHDPIFEDITRETFLNIWYSRSPLDLLPMTIRTRKFAFTDHLTGIGASIDSFYEYALKYSVLFDDEQFFQIWCSSYKALLTHSQNTQGLFVNVDVSTGLEASEWIDSLGGFFPGLQVLAGDIKNAILLHRAYLKLWNYYGAIPERWNYSPRRSQTFFDYLGRPYREGDTLDGFDRETTDDLLLRNSIALEWYPLRPEFIESTYHLYRATKDPLYLHIGECFLKRFRQEFIAPCGFSGVLDIRTGTRQDRMESFVLSETLKYLYLLFDDANELHTMDYGNTIFSTEGHPLWYDRDLVEKYSHFRENELVSTGNKNPPYLRGLFGDSKDYNEEMGQSFVRLKHDFYEYVKDNWTEIVVNKPVQQLFQDQGLGQLVIGQRAMVEQKLSEKLEPLLEEEEEEDELSQSIPEYSLDRDYLQLTSCEVLKQDLGSPFSRSFSEDRNFYRLDDVYSITLRRPPYLPERENMELELEPNFYDRFTSGSLQCAARPDTSVFEAVLDSGTHFHRASISRIDRQSDGHNMGVYIEDLDGFRSVFENAKAGNLDSFGRYVSQEEVSRFGNDSSNVLRVLKINGYWLKQKEMVWVSSNSQRLNSNEGIDYTGDGVILMNNMPVENMRVW